MTEIISVEESEWYAKSSMKRKIVVLFSLILVGGATCALVCDLSRALAAHSCCADQKDQCGTPLQSVSIGVAQVVLPALAIDWNSEILTTHFDSVFDQKICSAGWLRSQDTSPPYRDPFLFNSPIHAPPLT